MRKHDDAVRREDLVVMLGGRNPGRYKRARVCAHHQRIDNPRSSINTATRYTSRNLLVID